MSNGVWHDRSISVIGDVHNSLPENATLEERKKALRDAYPFQERKYFPYKAWCKAQKAYLAKFQPPKPFPEHLLDGWK
jgi:hypothetical protein